MTTPDLCEKLSRFADWLDELGTEFSVKQAVLIRQAISLLRRIEEPSNRMIHEGLKISGDFSEEGERIMLLEFKAMLKAAKEEK